MSRKWLILVYVCIFLLVVFFISFNSKLDTKNDEYCKQQINSYLFLCQDEGADSAGGSFMITSGDQCEIISYINYGNDKFKYHIDRTILINKSIYWKRSKSNESVFTKIN